MPCSAPQLSRWHIISVSVNYGVEDVSNTISRMDENMSVVLLLCSLQACVWKILQGQERSDIHSFVTHSNMIKLNTWGQHLKMNTGWAYPITASCIVYICLPRLCLAVCVHVTTIQPKMHSSFTVSTQLKAIHAIQWMCIELCACYVRVCTYIHTVYVHAWLCARVCVVESHSNSWHAQAPVQNVRNPSSSARVCVCACFSTFSDFFFWFVCFFCCCFC